MKKPLDLLESTVRAAVIVMFTVCLLVVAFQVFNRFVTKIPITWTSSLATIMLIWLGFLTAGLAVRRDEHFRMEALMHSMRGNTIGKLLQILSWLVILFASGVIFVYGIDMTMGGLREISPGLNVPMAYAYAALPVSAAISVVFGVEGLINSLRGRLLSTTNEEGV